MMLPNNRLIIIVCLSILIKSIIASSSSNYDNEKFTILTRNDFQTENYFATMKQDENVAKNGSQSSTFYDHPSSTMPIPNDSDDSKTENENSIELTTTVINLNINLMNETNNDFEISYNDVDCSEFNEQKLMNIVICSTEYINNASNNLNRSDVDDIWNSTKLLFGDEFNTTNIPNNTSTTIDEIDFDSTAYLVQVVTTSVILGIIILATVIGNVFVIAAILLEKNLQSVANYLILSLAVADLLVACLVMPLSAVYEISREWKLGPELCDMWTSSDVLCCTASILHLVAIALDRYWAVTNIDYAHQRTGQRIGIMIVILWVLSFFVSIAPMFGWKDPQWDTRLENFECLVSQDIGYQIFATASSFYVPLLAILFLYWRIYLVARKRIRRRQQVSYDQQKNQQQKKQMPNSTPPGSCIAQISGATIATATAVIGRPLPTISEATTTTTTTTTAFTNLSSTNASPEKCSIENEQSIVFSSSAGYPPPAFQENSKLQILQSVPKMSNKQKNRLKPSILKRKTQNSNDSGSKRERKAAKTLAIITGAFIVCWMPFFVIAVLLPICTTECEISPILISFFLWLGYFNSTLNPILYTIFNQDFRHAFMKILCGRNSRRSRRMCIKD